MLASVIFTSVKTVCKLPWGVGGWTPHVTVDNPPAYVVSSPSRGWQVPKRPHHTQCSWWNHHCAVAAAIHMPPSNWKQSPGRPNHTWLRAVESDLRPPNISPSYTWWKAACQEHWRSIVDTATVKKSVPRRERAGDWRNLPCCQIEGLLQLFPLNNIAE